MRVAIQNNYADAVCVSCREAIPVAATCYYERRNGAMCATCYEAHYMRATVPVATVAPLDAREQRIVKAHEENIKMLSDIVLMLGELVAIGKERNALLKEGRK